MRAVRPYDSWLRHARRVSCVVVGNGRRGGEICWAAAPCRDTRGRSRSRCRPLAISTSTSLHQTGLVHAQKKKNTLLSSAAQSASKTRIRQRAMEGSPAPPGKCSRMVITGRQNEGNGDWRARLFAAGQKNVPKRLSLVASVPFLRLCQWLATHQR